MMITFIVLIAGINHNAALLLCPAGQSHYSAIHSSDDDVWWINKEWLIDKASNYDSNSPHQFISNSISGKLLSKQIQTKEQSIMINSNSPYQFLSNSISGKLLSKQTQTKEQSIMINSNYPYQFISNSISGKLLSKQTQTKEQSIMINSNYPYQFISNSISGKLLSKQTQTKEQSIMINGSALLITRFFEMYTDYTEYKCEHNLVRVYDVCEYIIYG